MTTYATISGHQVPFVSNILTEQELRIGLAEAVMAAKPYDAYYVKENRPQGQAFSRSSIIDLSDYSDFILCTRTDGCPESNLPVEEFQDD